MPLTHHSSADQWWLRRLDLGPNNPKIERQDCLLKMKAKDDQLKMLEGDQFEMWQSCGEGLASEYVADETVEDATNDDAAVIEEINESMLSVVVGAFKVKIFDDEDRYIEDDNFCKRI